MNATQIKHVKTRLEDIYREKRRNVLSGYNAGYSKDEKIALYKEGNYSVDFDDRYGDFKIVWVGEKELKESREKRAEAIDQEYQKLLDQIILGDAADTLKMLETFRNKEF